MMTPAIAERCGREKEEKKERGKAGETESNIRRKWGRERETGLHEDHHRLIYNAGEVTEFTIKIPRSAALMDRRALRNTGDDSGTLFK